MELSAASARLFRLELSFTLDTLPVSVLWFRVMEQTGEWFISRHTHSSFEFHFVAAGACRVRLDAGEFTASAGELYLTPPGVFHEQSACGAGGYTEYSLNVDLTPPGGEGEGAALWGIFCKAECRPVRDRFDGIGAFDEALGEVIHERPGYYSAVRGLAGRVLIRAARALDETGGARSRYAVPRKASGDEGQFAAIRSFVEDNLSSRFTAEDLAGHVFLSSRQIDRILLGQTGLSTRKYINSLKLRKARALLMETGLSLGEIAARLGFSSEYYFSRFFKREEGFPPGMFRTNVRKT